MIDWLLDNHRTVVVRGRWIIVLCVFALLGIAQLPRNLVDRMIGVAGLVVIGSVFVGWVTLAILSLGFPRAVVALRRRRR